LEGHWKFSVAAIEFKDRRQTSVDEWRSKFESLLLSAYEVDYHIIFAGREEVDRNFCLEELHFII
jgi:hypothetical protein